MGSVAEETSPSPRPEGGSGEGSHASHSEPPSCKNLCYEPIASFEELMKYGEEGEESNLCSLVSKGICKNRTVPLMDKSFGWKKRNVNFKSTGSTTPRGKQPLTLVCHDLKGGYGDDRFVNGTNNHENYTYQHWLLTDIFVYFSHKLITIPPIGWINAAHSHGVKILGTIITEWDEGHGICTKILESEESIDATVQKLSKIIQDFGFDGYLLNIENKLDGEEQAKKMVQFTRKLRNELKKQSAKNLVIWYDSVTKDGELKWQDELNEKNKIFFDACDGIFLNYNWSEEKLRNSVNLAGEQRRHDIFCGVDCWGRGCWGGGGTNTCLAVEKIAASNVSVAFFAPGWSFESQSYGEYPVIDDELWTKCMRNLYARCLVQSHVPVGNKTISGAGGGSVGGANLNECDKSSTDKKFQILFATDFCRGYGIRKYTLGMITSQEPWFDLSKQSFQPVIFSSIKCLEYDCKEDQVKYANMISKKKKQEITPCSDVVGEAKVMYDILNGFFGGGSITLLNSNQRRNFENPMTSSPIWIPMDIPITASRLTLAVLAIWKSTSISYQLKIYLELGKEGCPNRKILLGDLDSLATSVRGKFFISLKLSDFIQGFENISERNDLEFHFQKNNFDEKRLNGWNVSCFIFDIDQVYDEYSSIKSLRVGADGDLSLGFLSLGQLVHYVQ